MFRRLHAARLIGRFPRAIDRLRDGRLCMTRLTMLKDVLNDANAERLFDLVTAMSKHQIKNLVADLQGESTPEKKRPVTIRKVPEPKPIVVTKEVRELRKLGQDAMTPPEPVEGSESPGHPDASEGEDSRSDTSLLVVRRSDKRTEIRPISGDRYDVSIRVSARFVELLKEATEAESHAVPDGNTEAILVRALELLVERAGKKTGKVPVRERKRPESQPAAADPDSAYIPAGMRREVFKRDGHSCSWPQANGDRCGSRHGLEPDHIEPRGKGGKTELSNLRLLCRAHNQQAARDVFGSSHIEARIRARRRPDD